ncbi:MAG TPA: hypothetical protein VEC35_09355 [Noviherbaspirillum sp.]|nr:hypothetical protein [Noviherbaspirillum sp.]
MLNLTGLPGVAGGKIDSATYFSDVADALRQLDKHRAVLAAGDCGAVTVYVDDAGKYRCAMHRRMFTLNESIVSSKAAVRAWLKRWHPQIQ